MKISLITPTRQRPEAFAFLERCIARQTLQPFEWIVCNDETPFVPYEWKMGQRVLSRHPQWGSMPSVCENLYHAAADGVSPEAEAVAICCDDDWYAPEYLERVAEELSRPGIEAVGVMPALWYNVSNRSMANVSLRGYSDLGSLSFRRCVVPWFITVCARANPHLDRCFWRNFPSGWSHIRNEKLHLALKGMPGLPGLDAQAHQFVGARDPSGEVLECLVGKEDAALLAKLGGFS